MKALEMLIGVYVNYFLNCSCFKGCWQSSMIRTKLLDRFWGHCANVALATARWVSISFVTSMNNKQPAMKDHCFLIEIMKFVGLVWVCGTLGSYFSSSQSNFLISEYVVNLLLLEHRVDLFYCA